MDYSQLQLFLATAERLNLSMRADRTSVAKKDLTNRAGLPTQ